MLFTSIIIFIGPFYLSISALELYHPQQASTLPGGVFKNQLKKHADVKKKEKVICKYMKSAKKKVTSSKTNEFCRKKS